MDLTGPSDPSEPWCDHVVAAGYDMEDAMILNKAAVDRGLAHGSVIKTEAVDLRLDKGKEMRFIAEVAGPRDTHAKPVAALGQALPQNVPSQAVRDLPCGSTVRGVKWLKAPSTLLPPGTQRQSKATGRITAGWCL